MQAELERRREIRRLGEYETIWRDPDFYLALPQIRDTVNPILDELKDSIREGDLLHHIDVTILNEAALQEYIDFVNYTWKTNVKFADCLSKQQPDGLFYLVVAGHTRHQAVTELNLESDARYWYELPAKIHRVTDPSEIIDIQVKENLHTVPRKEQVAIAYVEQYLWGRQRGKWGSQAEYIRFKAGKVSSRQLSEALIFANLSDEIKQYVFAGELSYSVALDVGRMHETIAEHTLVKMGGSVDTPELVEAFKLTVNRKMIGMINYINGKTASNNKKKNIGQAKLYIRNRKAAMLQEIAAEHAEAEVPMLDLDMITPDQQAAHYVAEVEKEFRDMLRHIEQSSIEATDQTLRLARRAEVSGVTLPSDTIERLHEEHEQRKRYFGATALVDTLV